MVNFCTDTWLIAFSWQMKGYIIFCVCLNEKLSVDISLSCYLKNVKFANQNLFGIKANVKSLKKSLLIFKNWGLQDF